jgi:flavin-dependent dehydrogenase
VVGADGARGLSRRTLGLEPVGESVGLGASLSGVDYSTLVLSFAGEGDAYSWIFPRPGGVSVGIAFSPRTLDDGAARLQLDGLLSRHLDPGWRAARGPRYRYPIPVYGEWSAETVAGALERRVLLVGDAAALADPLTREGIRYAALSGLWAAAAVLEGRPAAYLERLRECLAEELERAAWARELLFAGPIGQWMVPVAKRHAGIRAVLGDLLACRQPYRGLRRRLLRSLFARRAAA